MADAANPVTFSTVGKTVTVEVYPAFYDDCAKKGGIKLWPEKQADRVEQGAVTQPIQWVFSFASEAEATAFVTQSQAKVQAAKDALKPQAQPAGAK